MGEQVFRRCVACHTVEKGGSHGIGPNLHGVVGALVASKPGFSYSGAMKAKGGVWDETALDAYLKAPMKEDRKSVVSGKSVSGRDELGGRRLIKKKKKNK